MEERKKGMREHMLANSGCICFFPYPGRKGKGRRERGGALGLCLFFLLLLSFRRDGFGWLGGCCGRGRRKHTCFISCARVYLIVLDSDRLLAFLSLL